MLTEIMLDNVIMLIFHGEGKGHISEGGPKETDNRGQHQIFHPC